MTNEEIQKLPAFTYVRVTASDYAYNGFFVKAFQKRPRGLSTGAWRCVVEDANGRLFIHNPAQLVEIK